MKKVTDYIDTFRSWIKQAPENNPLGRGIWYHRSCEHFDASKEYEVGDKVFHPDLGTVEILEKK